MGEISITELKNQWALRQQPPKDYMLSTCWILGISEHLGAIFWKRIFFADLHMNRMMMMIRNQEVVTNITAAGILIVSRCNAPEEHSLSRVSTALDAVERDEKLRAFDFGFWCIQ